MTRVKLSLKSEGLGSFGYSLSKNKQERQKALLKAIKRKGWLTTLRRLVVIRTFHKSNEKLYKKLDSDVKLIQANRL